MAYEPDRPAAAASDERAGARWTVVIPVKPATLGKSRLKLPYPDRVTIVRAIALDTIEAAARCDRVGTVLVVTSDRPLADTLEQAGPVRVVADTAHGLSAAILLGLAVANSRSPRAVLLGDLPALKPHELSAALDRAAHHRRAFVPDADGTGTVLATAAPGVALEPCFGVDSAAAHRRAGFTELDLPAAAGLRRDLDTADQLAGLRHGALGARTAALLGGVC